MSTARACWWSMGDRVYARPRGSLSTHLRLGRNFADANFLKIILPRFTWSLGINGPCSQPFKVRSEKSNVVEPKKIKNTLWAECSESISTLNVAHTGKSQQLFQNGRIFVHLLRVRSEIHSIFDFLGFSAIFSSDRVDLASSNIGSYWSQYPDLSESVSIFAVAHKLRSGALGATGSAQRFWGHNFGIFSQF